MLACLARDPVPSLERLPPLVRGPGHNLEARLRSPEELEPIPQPGRKAFGDDEDIHVAPDVEVTASDGPEHDEGANAQTRIETCAEALRPREKLATLHAPALDQRFHAHATAR